MFDVNTASISSRAHLETKPIPASW